MSEMRVEREQKGFIIMQVSYRNRKRVVCTHYWQQVCLHVGGRQVAGWLGLNLHLELSQTICKSFRRRLYRRAVMSHQFIRLM
jgi:hypothetical protein